MLFDEAYKNGIFIFILTNNTYKSLLLKEIMDAALDINFPLEHILRGGSREMWTIWEKGMIKYNVLKYTNSDIYKCLGKDGYKRGLDKIIPAYQYDIDYLSLNAKKFRLTPNPSTTELKKYSEMLITNISSICDNMCFTDVGGTYEMPPRKVNKEVRSLIKNIFDAI